MAYPRLGLFDQFTLLSSFDVYQCLLGTGLTMADGIFTPAVSVTSAVNGISVAKPSVSKDIIPISIVSLAKIDLCLLELIPFQGVSRWSFPCSAIWDFETGVGFCSKYSHFCSLNLSSISTISSHIRMDDAPWIHGYCEYY
jgi:hypothetical protein